MLAQPDTLSLAVGVVVPVAGLKVVLVVMAYIDT